MAVILIDLAGFKPVNDQLGHEAGDQFSKRSGSAFILRMARTCKRSCEMSMRLSPSSVSSSAISITAWQLECSDRTRLTSATGFRKITARTMDVKAKFYILPHSPLRP